MQVYEVTFFTEITSALDKLGQRKLVAGSNAKAISIATTWAHYHREREGKDIRVRLCSPDTVYWFTVRAAKAKVMVAEAGK